ncbi:DNA damage-inducible transcript 3 protein isoform X2 [Hemiscyllium ocellatum]|nr:DNA damage-inducible transcript 3 protein isoform X2 [Hemiscyllium ocellatum]
MADWSTFSPFPAAAVPLSGQELEAWLEDLESVLCPSPAAEPPEGGGRRLKELWVDDVDSVLCPPPPPGDDAQRLNQLLLEDLESILYPAPVTGRPQHGANHGTSPRNTTQLEPSPPGPGDRLPSPNPGGTREEHPLLTQPPPRRSDLPGPAAPSSSSTPPPCSPPGRGARTRGRRAVREGGRCPSCWKEPTGGAAERLVEELTRENEALRRRIEELAREVQEARRRLIERVVDTH